MELDYNKKYFLMSFRFNKETPEDFGLIQAVYNSDIYVNISDNSEWVKRELYDLRWGYENGFMRLPPLGSLEIWNLLVNSDLQENKYGAAHLLVKEYPDDLLKYVLEILNDPNVQISESTKEVFKILNLDIVINRCSIIGKTYQEVEKDYENWKFVSNKVIEILK